ncbi:MAG: carboxy terminal-processing peptidase [Bacteroidota bacterium]|nr:carboxy terminal-processing peptidase [Bacteroidota bacterium]
MSTLKSISSKITKKALIVFSVVVLSSFTFLKYSFDKNDVIFELMFGSLNQNHYSPLKVDDAFSEKVFDLYIKRIDYSKKFLLQSDIDELAKSRRDIDNQILNQRHDFYKKSLEIITQRIKDKENWSKEILSKPLDYSTNEEYQTDGEKATYAKSEAELKAEWKKMITYQVLSRIDDQLNRQEKAIEKKDTTVKIKIFDSIEVDARRKTLKANEDWFKRLSKISSRERFSQFANAVTGVYDPHTEYFAPKEKKKFDQSMSGQFEGIGARLQSVDGLLKISEVIPGSPSAKQGELKAGDFILAVAQGTASFVDITNMDMEDAIDLIKGKKGTQVRLNVKKPDNSLKEITIERDVIEIEETFAKSAVLDNKNKTGYIYLPSFYTNFSRLNPNDARYCSKDIRKEIEKLKKQNIKGLILDLRDNGGGSLQEVVEMAGLFFPKGPVVQVRGKSDSRNVMEDKNPDVAWDGPLVVMINHSSASASEILAAAIQDYKRGVIVGTPSFGKGTVQSFVELDYYLLPQFDTIKPVGSIKITQQKFYRINGGATQLKGVTPDVLLPDPYEFIDLGEKEMDNPMPWDEISKANYEEFKTINYPLVIKNSQQRIKKSTQFALVDAQAKDVKSRKDDTKYSLNLEKFRAEQKQFREQNKKYEDLRKEIKGFNASLLDEDIAKFGSDTSRAGRETRWAKNIAKDIYIHEANNVLNDLK